MTTAAQETKAIQLLVDAQRTGGKPVVSLEQIGDINLEAGYRISAAQTEALGEKVGLYKTIIRPDDNPGLASPIWASRVGNSGADFVFPSNLLIKGLEVEIGIVLAKDIEKNDNVDEEVVAAAVDHYFLGIEVVGSRIVESTATPAQALADNSSALGHVIGGKYARGRDFENLTVTLEVDGKEIDRQPAKHGCGTVLASVAAYAKAQHPSLPLKAGTVITTGSLNGCVLMPANAKGLVVARLGDEKPVQFMLP